MADGILLVNKESGMTSHDVVSKVRRIFSTRRVGHAGTLDPMATGVLCVMVGSATAASDFLMNHDKVYRFGIELGTQTDTGDITGNVICRSKVEADLIKIDECALSFVGKQSQIPPMYSALKVDGKKLYELAREGKTVERKARDIEIYSLKRVESISAEKHIFDVSCSKGTYIRTLCEDIGQRLGCGACMMSLQRQKSGNFELSECHTLSEIEACEDKQSLLTSVETVFENLSKVKLNEFYSTLCKNGAHIYFSKAKIDEKAFEKSALCRVYDNNGEFFALGEKRTYPEGNALKATVRFDTKRG